MKRKIVFSLLCWLLAGSTAIAQTSDEWVKQKKTQRKYMLQQIAKLQLYITYVKKGYDLVHSGLNVIEDIKSGDLQIHSVFLDRLKQISPAVQKYKKVTEIITLYIKMGIAWKTKLKDFRAMGNLSQAELDNLYYVFTNIIDQAGDDIEQLTEVITNHQLEMDDSDRLKRIDHIHQSVSDKYANLYSFYFRTETLSLQRQKERRDLQTLKNIYRP